MRKATMTIYKSLAGLMALSCLLCTSDGFAVQLEFQIQGSSSLTANPYLDELDMFFSEQGPGSLTTTYSGTITVDVDDVMNPTSITFVSANAIAANSGDWLPQEGGGDGGDPEVFGDANPGTAMPANYGFVINLSPALAVFYGASRETVFSMTADARAVSGGEFAPADILLPITHGYFDANISSQAFPEFEGGARAETLYDPTPGEPGDEDDDYRGVNCTDFQNPGNSCGTDMGSYSVAGNLATLTFPLSFHVGGGSPVVQFTGTFTATASLIEELQGDYNEDGTVNAADYTVWRDGGSPDSTQAGYDLWKANFGNSGSGSGNSATGAAVPEPASVTLYVLGLLGLWFGRRAVA